MTQTFDTDFIQEEIEKTPYTEDPAKEVFERWCNINDSVRPIFLPRQQWEEREEIFDETPNASDGKSSLYIPEDINLLEMVDIISAVDKDTFRENPQLAEQKTKEIQELGNTFKQAGVYIDENIKNISEGKDIAEDMAKKFFNYGLSLQAHLQIDSRPIKGITLNEDDKRKLDQWLLGTTKYKQVMGRLGNNPSQEEIDKERARYFKGYFKALDSEGYENTEARSNDKGPIKRLQDSTRVGIKQAISTPQSQMYSSIFDRGGQKLVKEMKIPKDSDVLIARLLSQNFGMDIKKDEQTLYNFLNIPKLKAELKEVRKSGSIPEISAKEVEIAMGIHRAITYFPYSTDMNNPSEMVLTREANCLGAAILGGRLLDELKIKYIGVNHPGHAATLLVTSDNQIYWQDFTPSYSGSSQFFKITPDMLANNIDLSKLDQLVDTGKSIQIRGQLLDITLLDSKYGLQEMLLNNMAYSFYREKRFQEMAEIARLIIQINPRFNQGYEALGIALSNMKDTRLYEEVVKNYKKAIELQPSNYTAYYNLGIIYNEMGKYPESVDAYENALKFVPDERQSLILQSLIKIEEMKNHIDNHSNNQ